MVNIKKIELERLEGPISSCTSVECKTFTEANWMLYVWSASAPKDFGYDKYRFSIEWEDGETYTGRYDLVHYSRRTDEGTGKPDLVAHIMGFIDWVINREDNRDDYESERQKALNFLDNYLPQRNYAKGAA